jgi:hypothetical protein
MLTTDRLAGGALVLVALSVLWESRRLPLGTLHTPGPAYMPVVLALLLLLFGALIAATGGHAGRLTRHGWPEWRHAAAIVGACAFAAWGLERLGYRLTIAVTLGFLLGVVERKGLLCTVVLMLALALGSFFLFNTLLRVPLPRGPFGL